MPREILAQEAAQFIATRRDLWEAMHRDGWYLPKLSAAVTLAYMEAVRARRVWCPRYADVRLRPCLVPPPTKQLLAWIEEALRIQRANFPARPVELGFAKGRCPDAQWALNALSTLLPTHRIFGKGYVREPPPLDGAVRPVIDNADGLFDGLPPRRGKPAKRTILKKTRPSAEARV
jgi:hypothetical protein